MINTEKLFQLFKFDNCNFVNFKSSVRHHMRITHKTISVWIMQLKKECLWHHEDTHSKSPQKTSPLHGWYIPSLNTISRKKGFDYAHPPYDPKFTKCLMTDEGYIQTANMYFSPMKVVINHQAHDRKNIYTCSLCIKYIPPEESRSPKWFFSSLM